MDQPLPDARAAGRRFWRTLEERFDLPEFRERLRREHPEQAEAWLDPVTRRGFLALLGASLGLAGLSGCSSHPPNEKILPYNRQPEGLVPGKPLFFATAMPLSGDAVGLLVESHEGRPTKIEGNPDHPASLGATDVFSQASVLGLYDPDRSQTVLFQGRARAWSEGQAGLRARLTELAKKEKKDGGAGVRILTEASASPALEAMIGKLLDEKAGKLPKARWVQYEPGRLGADRKGAELLFGRPMAVRYDFAAADVILSLDADFLSCGGGQLAYTRAFTARRRAESNMNRLYAVESTPTNTGMVADHRLPLRPGDVEAFLRLLAVKLGVPEAPPGGAAVLPPGRGPGWIDALADDLNRRRGKSAVVPGEGQPAAVHALAHAVNAHLGNVGKTVFFAALPDVKAAGGLDALKDLADELDAGTVEVLLILGGNPAYTAPADLKFADRIKDMAARHSEAVKKATGKVPEEKAVSLHLGLYADETAAACDWHLPAAHYLESWGDARAFDGTASIIQPLIAPLYPDAVTPFEVLSALADETNRTAHQVVREYWLREYVDRKTSNPNDADRHWDRALHDGVVPGTRLGEDACLFKWEAPAPKAGWAGRAGFKASVSAGASEGVYDAVFRLDPTVYDGRFANNGWLQELPKPLSKLTWDNAAIIGPQTAAALGVKPEEGIRGGQHGEMITDMLELSFDDGRRVKAPAWIVPGCTEGVVTLHFGYGRKQGGKVAAEAGEFNAYELWKKDAPFFEGGLKVRKLDERFTLACVQGHHRMDVAGVSWNRIAAGLAPIRSGTKAAYDENNEFLNEGEFEQELGLLPEDDLRSEKAREKIARLRALQMVPPPAIDLTRGNRWGMSIDVGACVGCGACVVACQAENNIPVVGKLEVTHAREMHWLRVDRYFEGADADPTRAYFQPVPCMQCENAPCEQVCPVAATVHSPDGLNEMVYNRCVGTRYCSNNCPYKVRRFNFLHFADFVTPSLKLLRNPDVTVRSRGVMEKCTFCVQRIREAEIETLNRGAAPVEAERGRLPIADGAVLTACQAACPAEAIVFGDMNDPKSAVLKRKLHPLNYGLLADLNTRPRVSYLAALRNPNPALEAEAT
jgi:molybdopterin-containing oxidoreductase family iron-sulfur binding subunit